MYALIADLINKGPFFYPKIDLTQIRLSFRQKMASVGMRGLAPSLTVSGINLGGA